MSDTRSVKFFGQWRHDHLEYTDKLVTLINSKEYTDIIIDGKEEWQINYDENLIKDIDIALGNTDTILHIIHGTDGPPSRITEPTTNTLQYYWPMYWAYGTYQHGSGKISPYSDSPTFNFKKHFISLNNKAHNHRRILLDLIHKEKLERFLDFSLQEINPVSKGSDNWYENKYWEEKITVLDQNYADTLESYSNIPDQMFTAAFNIIPESTTQCKFWTEKTFTAICLEKPFLIFGAPNINVDLKKFGFKLFDELINYDFDNIQNTVVRYQQGVRELAMLAGRYPDPGDLYNDVKSKVLYNKENLKDILDNKKFFPKTIQNLLSSFNISETALGIVPDENKDFFFNQRNYHIS